LLLSLALQVCCSPWPVDLFLLSLDQTTLFLFPVRQLFFFFFSFYGRCYKSFFHCAFSGWVSFFFLFLFVFHAARFPQLTCPVNFFQLPFPTLLPLLINCPDFASGPCLFQIVRIVLPFSRGVLLLLSLVLHIFLFYAFPSPLCPSFSPSYSKFFSVWVFPLPLASCRRPPRLLTFADPSLRSTRHHRTLAGFESPLSHPSFWPRFDVRLVTSLSLVRVPLFLVLLR